MGSWCALDGHVDRADALKRSDQVGDGPRAARKARLLADPDVTVPVLDEATARAVGLLRGTSDTSDVVDAHVVLHALERGHHIVTSDPDDLRRVHPEVVLIEV